MPSCFSQVNLAAADPILGLTAAFEADERERKVNLSIGVYKSQEGKVPILACVKQAERILLDTEKTKNYLPIEGSSLFLEQVFTLLFNQDLFRKNVSIFQTIGGCGALRLGGDLIQKEITSCIHIPDPSWPNHRGIFSQCGLKVEVYPYYDGQKKTLFWDRMLEYFSKLAPKSVILLHANCHNPTGTDLTKNEWQVLAALCKQKQLIPFFDAAYLGFDEGVEEDAYPIRLFAEKEIEFFLATSFSKNMALYGERVGCLSVFSDSSYVENIKSQCRGYIRRNYSNPDMHGSGIVSKILSDANLKCLWQQELGEMRQRIINTKEQFFQALASGRPQKNYDFILEKKGLFALCDFSVEQIERLKKEHAVYLTLDGRINLAGLTQDTLPYVVEAILAVGG